MKDADSNGSHSQLNSHTHNRTHSHTHNHNSPEDSIDSTLYQGLQELAESAFPKRCATCGRTFDNAQEFVKETERVRPNISGLKSVEDEDGSMIVELFRNCPCGSTLMDAFNDRRDLTQRGLKRRERFGELLDYLVETHNLEPLSARDELLKVMRGEGSKILHNIQPPPKKPYPQDENKVK